MTMSTILWIILLVILIWAALTVFKVFAYVFGVPVLVLLLIILLVLWATGNLG